MDIELVLAVVSRIVHVLTAIVLIGGSVFTAFVLLPSARQIGDSAHATLAAAVVSRWRRFVHIGVLLFLVTGIYNYSLAIPQHRGDGPYHAMMGTKILLALVVFFIAAALVGRSARLEKIRQRRGTWLTVLVVLAVVIVSISGYLKIRSTPTIMEPAIATEQP